MTEYLRNAWSGWTGYTTYGKLPALLLAVLLYLWFGRGRKEQGALTLYASVTSVCCILPVTAAALMLYQTRFYNYEWIWSLVPMTAVTAWGLTLFWTASPGRAGQWKTAAPAALLLLTALCFCGSMGRQVWDAGAGKEERAGAYAVLGQIADRYPDAELCLWAPREIMEYAREKDASIRLPYGRNIWDGALNAYAYDGYGEDIALLEQWMENPDGTGEITALEDCVAKARQQGVNCILIPGDAAPETVARMEKAFGAEGEALEGYYLFYTGEEDTYGRAD